MERRSLIKKSLMSFLSFFSISALANDIEKKTRVDNAPPSNIAQMKTKKKQEETNRNIDDDTNPEDELTLDYRLYTVKRRLDESLSVKAFGALGDGKNDDTLAIQNAIDYSKEGIINFPAGVYKITKTLKISKNGITVRGSRAYLGGAIISCATPNMLAILITSYGVKIENIFIDGYENKEEKNDFGQIASCIGIKFSRDTGSKDLDSIVENCLFRYLKCAILGYGSNLKIANSLFTSTPNAIDLIEIQGQEFRGHVINNNRFHKCGGNHYAKLFPDLKKSACIKLNGHARAMQINDNYADFGIYSFFNGQLMRGSSINNNIIYRADSDIIVIDNSLSTEDYESFLCTSNILSNDSIVDKNESGYLMKLTSVNGALISNNLGSFLRKGGISCTSVSNCLFSQNMFKNINTASREDGIIYSGIELDVDSKNNKIDGLTVFNTRKTSTGRSAIHNEGKENNVSNLYSTGATQLITESETATTTDVINNNLNARRTEYRSSRPTKGNYQTGDVWYSINPEELGYIGEVCVLQGSPGKWRAFGKIE